MRAGGHSTLAAEHTYEDVTTAVELAVNVDLRDSKNSMT